MLRDRRMTEQERANLALLLRTLPEAEQRTILRRIRTVTEAAEWFEHVAVAQTFGQL